MQSMIAQQNLTLSLTTAILVGFVVFAPGQSPRGTPATLNTNYSPAGGGTVMFIAGADGKGLSSVDGTTFIATTVTVRTDERSWCHAAGIVVRISRTGQLSTSYDGTVWTAREAGVPFALYRVTFGNNRFVAVGNEGAIVTSGRGLVWTLQNSPTDERLRGVAYANGIFVAVGYAGTILTSRDGLHWTRRRSGTEVRLQDVVFAKGSFFAVGWHGTILTSCDGMRWRRIASGTTNHLLRVSVGDHSIANGTLSRVQILGSSSDADLPGSTQQQQASRP